MRFRLLTVGFVSAVVAGVACSSNDNTSTIPITVPDGSAGTTDGAAGAAGTSSAAGTTGTAGMDAGAGTTGAAGTSAQAFVAVDPCNAATDYTTTTTITVDPNVIGYMPKCVKVSAGSLVTIGASTVHPLSGTTDGSANNPIPLHQMTPQTVAFPTPGFYSFHCDVHFSVGMKGVIWVTP
jgi:plastocyanin